MSGLDVDNTNVIKIKFGKIGQPTDGKEFILDDDPLEDILGEYEGSEVDEEAVEQVDYLHHAREYKAQEITYKMDSTIISDILLEKMSKLKEDVTRTNYYLDELNLD